MPRPARPKAKRRVTKKPTVRRSPPKTIKTVKARSKRGRSWEDKLSPQQRAALTRAREALVRARGGEVLRREAQYRSTLERAGAPARSVSSRVGAATRARNGREAELERRRRARKRRARAEERRRAAEAEERQRSAKRRESWLSRLTQAQIRAITATQDMMLQAPAKDTIQTRQKGKYEEARRSYIAALRRAKAPADVIRARVAAVDRLRRRFTVIRRNALAPIELDARRSRTERLVLTTMVEENDKRFRAFMASVLPLGLAEKEGKDWWFSPQAL